MLNANTIHGFVGSMLAKKFDGATKSPGCHMEWWDICCSPSRYVALAAPRGHAKSTAVTLCYGLATLLFRERKFMLMVSDTEAQASMFLGSLKQELQDNDELIDLFGLKRDEKGLVKFIKDSETDIIVEFEDGHKFRVIAKGAEQKLRGLNWNGTRPDLIIGDDIENDELVMNKDRREKMRRWFYSALLPALSPHGLVRIVGTILHMDSLLERLMPENQLLTKDKKAYLVEEPLRTYTTRRLPWKSMRYRAHSADFTSILWKERFDAQFFKDKYLDYSAQGLPDAYSQEYLNIPIDESTAYFKKTDFLALNDEERKARLNYYITVDLAISGSERADYSVFLVAGIDENKRIQVRNVIRDRLDGREIVDTILALQTTYDPIAIGIEDMQVSKSIGPFLYEEMINRNVYPTIVNMKHMGQDKLTRARSIQARMRAGGVKFDKDSDWYQTFEDECSRFPRDKNDDQVDAFAYLGLLLDKLIEAPTDLEVAKEEYEDELNDSGLSFSGRNSTTGY
jgi:predicted phage terminase large subunit-like protein